MTRRGLGEHGTGMGRAGGPGRSALAVLALALLAGCETQGVSTSAEPGPELPTVPADAVGDAAFVAVDTGGPGADVVPPDTGGEPDAEPDAVAGDFGAACSDGAGCYSGWCVDALNGPVCTKTCDATCPPGWKCKGVSDGSSDITFICVPEHLTLCRPCNAPLDCASLGFEASAICRDTGDAGSFCATACDGTSCPDGYACEANQSGGSYCVPADGGECACDAYAMAQKLGTACATTNEHGTCPGQRRCDAGGLSACDAPAAAPEVCNGKDDDCDGVTDEPGASAEPTCEVAGKLGACAVGAPVCQAGQVACLATTQPTGEVCNGQDDDCDGETDEAGAAGCTKLYRDADEDGFGDETDMKCLCGPAPPYTATALGDCDDDEPLARPGNVEVCDGVDNNCDGAVDGAGVPGCEPWYFDGDGDGFGDAKKFFCQCGPAGSYSASEAGDCDDKDGGRFPGAPEVCDGVDQDCDGAVDEKANQPPECPDVCPDEACAKACSLAAPCASVCGSGTQTCLAGAWKACTADAPNVCYDAANACEAYETCGACDVVVADGCDGLDDDCDGLTDEDAPSMTVSCGLGVCAAAGVETCEGGVMATACTPDAAAATAETCNGVDDDCDGLTDAGDADLALPACELQEGVCAGATMAPDQCGASGWPGGCGDARYLAHSDAFEPGVEASCDGVDNDCDGGTDEDFGVTTADGAQAVGAGAPCGTGACAGGVVVCDEGGATASCSTAAAAVPETCNGVDDDCDGETDEGLLVTWYLDADGDGYGDPNVAVAACSAPDEHVGNAKDCDDSDDAMAPGKGEVCDAKDNDCDGTADQLEEPCDLGCAAGTRTCADGAWSACDAPAPTSCLDYDTCTYETLCVTSCPEAPPELCNGLDDDCDAATDEGLGQTKCGLGACAHTVDNCAGGSPQACDPWLGASDETCDGADDDCDGLTDEDLGTLDCGLGACDHTLPACVDGKPQACDPLEGATPEACDGVDNDCDGQTDESLSPLSCGLGACAKTVPSCVGGVPQTCDPLAGQLPEVCDGVDNDCDGQTDENNPGGGGFCTVPGTYGPCKNGQLQCQGGSLTCAQIELGSGETCDGLDNDCDGLTDENNPGGGGSCSVPGKYGECAKGQMQCQGGSLSCAQTTFAQAESCDGKDNDCDGQTDGFTQSCSAACGTGSRTCSFGSWTPCSGPGQVCSPTEPCCSSNGCGYLSASTKCDPTPYSTVYQCTSSSGCGGSAQKRSTYRYCTGTSSSCGTGNLKQDSSWTTLSSCSSNATCYASSSTAYCSTCSSGKICVSGSCVTQCGNGVCDAGEDPSTCVSDCQAWITNPHTLYYKQGVVGTVGKCTTAAGWHTGKNGELPHWTWESACGLPSTGNLYDYQGYSARWHVAIKKSGYYRVTMWVPCTAEVCTVNGVSPANRYASGVYFGITTSGSSGVLTSALNLSPCGSNAIFSSVYLAAGTHYLVAYDRGSSGNVCNTAGSTANKWVFVDNAGITYLGP